MWEWFGQFDIMDYFKQVFGYFFKCSNYIFLFYEIYFVVNLSEFRLVVGMQVFVMEIFGYLEIMIEIGNY